MINDVKNHQENNPTVYNDKVGYRRNGTVDCKLSFGYKTAFAYFSFHERKKISEKSLNENIGLLVRCGKYSYAKIIDEFGLIMGLSGTLQSLTPTEKKIICGFNIQRVAAAPSIYGTSQLKYIPSQDTIILSEKEWLTRVIQITQQNINGGKAVIIFFENTDIIKQFQNMIKDSISSVQVLTEETVHKDNVIRKSTISGTVTLCSRVFNRGTDFICLDPKTESAGGVHVISTFLPESQAESVQMQGRTARQGNPGTYAQLLCKERLVETIDGFTIDEFEKQLEKGDHVKWIIQLRDKMYENSVKDLIEKEKSCSQTHQRTKQYIDALVNYIPTPEADKTLREKILELNADTIAKIFSIKKFHIYFCLDDSSSMGGKPWRDLMAGVKAFLDRRLSHSNQDLVTIVNYSDSAEVKCRNINILDEPHTKTSFRGGCTDFAAGLQCVENEMKNIGDSYEPILVFMSDGGCNNGDVEIERIAKDFAKKNIQVFVLGFGSGCDQNRLKRLSSKGNGQYFFGANAAELKEEFEEMSDIISSDNLRV